ncbi:MAG: CBS domain-containing protein, partial [Nitrospirota bacterium]|nr:CBS domain-containing protein [Nitrospirota bacterium]
MKAHQSFYESFLSYHPEEAASILESFSFMEILRLMSQTTSRNVANLISGMTPALAVELLRALPDGVLHSAIPEFSPPVLASFMTRMSPEERERFQQRIPSSAVKELLLYMDFPEETAGHLMDPRVIALPGDWSVGQAIEQIRTSATNEVHEIYVIDREQVLVGKVPLRELLITPLDERLLSIMDRDLLAIHPLELREQILELFNQGKVLRIPVVDLDGHLLGVIRNRAMVKASQEDATADMQTMVGASADERALSPPWFAVCKRLPWLQVNLLTAFLAAFVVGLFENTISQFTALAVLLPVVAGQSGNTGAQSLARSEE